MVAIVAGSSFGLGQTSAKTLGSSGILGNPSAGFLGSNFLVNASTGNVIIQNQDEILQGIGQDTILTRTYNSLGLMDDDNADNWRESSQRAVNGLTGTVNTAGSTVTRTDWDGSRQVFTWDATKSAYIFKDPAGAYDKLTYASGTNKWTWVDGNSRVTELYDNANSGRIVSSLDTDGKGQTFTYTGTQLTRVTNSDGGYVVLAWTGSNLTQLTSYKSDNTLLAARVRYAYDGTNRLTTVTVDLSPADNAVADGNTVTYTYTYDGTSKRVASISETGSSAMVAFTYNATTQKVTSVTETAASGDVRAFTFDYSVANHTKVTDSQGSLTDYGWDANGRLTSVAYPTSQTVNYAWDATTGRIATVTDALGNARTYTYDAATGNLTRTSDTAGNQIDYVYDATTNALLTETHYLVPDPDGAGAGVASSPVTTRYVYNAQQHLRYSISAEGQVTEYIWDTTAGSTWKLLSTIKYTANLYDTSALTQSQSPSEATMSSWAAALSDRSTVERTDMVYDFRGNVSTVTEYTAASTAGAGLTTSTYTVTTYVYDQFGLLLNRQVSGRTGAQVYTYDGLGRMLSSTDFAGNATTIAFTNASRRMVVTLTNGETVTTNFNALGQAMDRTTAGTGATSQVETYKYDSVGRLKTTVDALAKKDYTFYDASGRKTGYMDRLGNLTEYRYDAGNRLVATIEYSTTISSTSLFDASGNPLNVAIATVRPTSSANDLWTWNVYDAANRLTGTIASDGAVVKYTYDGDSQLVQTTSFTNRLAAATVTGYRTTLPTTLATPTTSTTDRPTRYFYDKAGEKIGTLDADGALTRTLFDGAGRVTETVQYASLTTAGLRAAGTWAQLLSSVTTTTNPADRHQYFAYDGQGNLRYTLDAKLRPIETIYNAAGDAIRTIAYGAPITATTSYTAAYIQGQISTLNLAAGSTARTARTTFDGAGRKAFDINAEGFVTAYAYNNLNQVVKVTQYATAFATAGDQTLSAMQTWATGNANAADRVTRSVYDGLGRVAYEVNAEGYVTEHQYDQKNQLVKDIRYPAVYTVTDSVTQSSLATQIGAVPAAAITTLYEYDANGNRTKVTDGEGYATLYAFDTFGRNTTITNVTTGIVTRMVYDALDRVTQSTTAYGTSEALSVSFAYDGAGNLSSSTDARGSTTNFTYDALGNQLTRVVPLASGVTATTTNTYDAFGNVLSTTDPLTRTSTFTYDALDNLISKVVPLYYDTTTSTTITATTSYQYDAFGNMVATTDPRNVTTWYYYDRLDRLVYTVDGEGYATQNSYSIGGALTSVRRMATKPTGTGSTTTRPTFTTNNTTDGLTGFALDKLDRVTMVTDAEAYHEDYTLDAFGNRTSVKNKLGYSTTNVFDKRGLLKQETLPVGSTRSDGTVQATNIVNTYTYDSNGNRTQMVEASGLTEQRTTTYTYDKNNRLTQKSIGTLSVLDPATMAVSSVAGTEFYSYDANGNVIETKDANGGRTLSYYDLANRKTAQVSPIGTLSTWSYDANGNALSARVYGDLVALPSTPGGTVPSPVVPANYRETTYSYDYANRQTGTAVTGLTTGAYNGSAYTTSTAAVTTAIQYDKAGNVIVQTDGRTGKIYTFYDNLNRKVGQIDQAGYVTKFTLDHEGNVTQEKRFATKYTGAITAGGTLPLPTADAVNDRTTDFTYDRNGRRKTETRQSVKIATVTTSTIAESTVSATITYNYNGLGLVTSKQEATGDTTSYGYDQIGRQTSITGQSFTDYTGATVSNQQAMSYDGLNNVARSVENGSRITTYTYGTGGRLVSTTDALSNTTKYFYDAAGRVTATSYKQVKADGTFQYVAQALKYDLAGHQLSQKTFTSANETTWTGAGDLTEYFYDAWGEVVARGTNVAGVQANAQEFNEYDKAGRVWRTNFNDGVTKAYIYDANGNATLLMQSIGTANLKTGYTAVGTMLADTAVSKTISVFDARNQLTNTIQSASNNAGASPIHATQVTATGSGTVYFNSAASISGSNRTGTGAAAYYVSSASSVSAVMAGYTSVSTTSSSGVVQTIQVNLANLPQNGGGNIHVVLENDQYDPGDPMYNIPPTYSTNSVDLGAYAAGTSSIYIGNAASAGGAAAYTGYSYQRIVVYQDAPGGGRLTLSQTQVNYNYYSYVSGGLDGTTGSPAQLQIQNENVNTAVIRVFGRAQGSSGPYSWIGTANQIYRADGSALIGWFSLDASGLQSQNWDLRYFAFDSVGNPLDVKSATYQPGAYVRITPTSASLTASNAGLISESNTLVNGGADLSIYAGSGSPLGSIELQTRPAGSGSFTSQRTVGVSSGNNGYFYDSYATIHLSDLAFTAPNGTTALDYQLVYRDTGGAVIGVSSGTMSGPANSQTNYWQSDVPVNGPGQTLATWDGPYYTLLFTGVPVATQSMRVYYRLAGTNNAFTQLPVNPTARGGAYGQAGWWSGRPPADGQTYEYWMEPLDGGGAIIGGRSYGTFVGGNGNPSGLTQYSAVPSTVNFQPPSGQTVTSQRMRYSSNGGGSWSGWVTYSAGGTWSYDASGLAPDFYSNYNYSVEYETYNGATMLSRATGSMALGYNGRSISLANIQSIAAKVQFNPAQTGGNSIKLFYRTAGSTGAYASATITKSGGVYAWDVDAAGVRPASGSLQLEYYYDVYDASGVLMNNLVGSDHVQGKMTIYSDRYVNTSDTEIRWVLDTATASQFLINRRQTHNAFGDVDSETDGRNNTTTLVYNTEGKLIQRIAPQVSVTSEAGVTTNVNPTEYYYYDKSGRQVAQKDANGNLTTQVLLAGTGYGGSQAQVVEEYRADLSNTTHGYDVWGDERKVTDWINRSSALGNVTTKLYDANHNLTEVDHAVRSGGNSPGVQLKDYYAYDALGQRIKHWNSQLTASVVETTDYDIMGRVTRTVSMTGQTVNYSYTWYAGGSGGINTVGLGNFGGWQKATTITAGVTAYENLDLFGRSSWRQDYGGHQTGFTYDNVGHLLQQTNTAGQNITFAYYENGYVKSVTDNTLKLKSTFEYDNDGNRTLETYNSTDANPIFYQNASITWDAMNRMTRFLDAKADITYKYDAVGNRRNVKSVYQDGVGGGQQTQDYWYKYDKLNRFTTTMGILSGGAISRGTTGVDITYDTVGNRATATYGYDNHIEAYSYTADGYLENTTKNGVLLAKRTNDALGRVTQYTEYAADGVTATLSRSSTFDNDNRVTTDTTNTVNGSVTTTVVQTYDYKAWNGSAYAGADQGVITHTRSDQTQSGSSTHVYTDTNYYYVWWDEAKQSSIRVNASNPSNPNTGLWAPGLSNLSYDVNGHIVQLVDQTAVGGAKTVNYRNDAYGQILVREEQQNGVIGPRQLYYYFNGMRIGDVGNNGQSTNLTDYAQQLAARGQQKSNGLYRNGRPVASADFDENYQPINAGYPGMAATTYTARTGDTMRSIAQALWGDGAMWYLIAEANGLSATSQLSAGQRLIIPNKVTNIHNNSGTFRVYDPGEAIGDTLPTLPNEPAPPPARKKGGCGGFGAILLAVVAIVVTAIVAPELIGHVVGATLPSGAVATTATGLSAVFGATGGAIVGGALAGVAGSLVSQGVGLATGLQDKFSWSAVGMAAIGGAVGGAVGPGGLFKGDGLFGGMGSKVVGTALRGAVSSVVTQGIGVATGLQDRFDWAGVAAAGVGAGVGSWVGGTKFATNLGDTGATIVSGLAGGLAASAAESLVTGRDFGDTLMANLPGILGNTIGNAIVRTITALNSPKQDKDDIVVNRDAIDQAIGNLPSSLPSTNIDLTLSPESRIALMESSGEISSVTASGLRARVAEIKTELRDSYVASKAVASPAVGSDGLPFLQTIDKGYAIDLATVDAWESGYRDAFSQGKYSVDGLNDALGRYENNRNLIRGWDAIADREVNKLLFVGAGAPALLAGGAVAAPLVAGYAGSFYAGGTVGSIVSTGSGFVTGGTFGVGFEFAKNTAFGLENSKGGYTAAFIGGGLGGAGLRMLPTRYLTSSLGQVANRGLVGAFSGLTGEFSGQLVTNGGDLRQIDSGQLLLQTGIGGLTGAALPDVQLKGFTSGRNNSVAIYTGLQTKLNNGSISQFRLRYAGSAGAANAVKGLYGQAAGATADGVIKKVVGQ